MKTITSILGVTALAATSAHGWGATGHQAVGYVAMQFLGPRALSFVQSSLGSTYNESLGPAATVRTQSTPEKYKTKVWMAKVGRRGQIAKCICLVWIVPQHSTTGLRIDGRRCTGLQAFTSLTLKMTPQRHALYLNLETAPITIVSVVGAIANYTTRVITTSLSAAQRQEALKFLVVSFIQCNTGTLTFTEFIGDIGQPLHVEALEAGGNGVSAKCSGSSTNLHSVWDSGIVNKLVAADYSNSAITWANALATRIKNGSYKSLASGWISCSSTTTPVSIAQDISNLLSKRTITPLQCPLVWAKESNALDCSVVFDFTTGQDLCTSSYYNNAVPAIETQIAKQGYRLAAWLNVLFDGDTNLPLGTSSYNPA
ncbi:hypothetical protein D9756_003984 [Leucocoprinus leucothites]|uniref:Uncharacterized protein n=1 Tax=Leucocoprinus leucothites TaxID=201217 RepID=A0A8H5D9T0_9AGAR|nr:hypothetical protein D9756_003984 [Leucoagaricus leucothites]